MKNIRPIILCGGSGSRLWPLSTPAMPKQFIKVKGVTLLQRTLNRIESIAAACTVNFLRPILVMNSEHSVLHSHDEYDIVYEDYCNDTSVAILRALLLDTESGSDTSVIVFPADHHIGDEDAFVNDIVGGISAISEDNIVLFGLCPTAPESKYGYIIPSDDGIKFIEKPSSKAASGLIDIGALWNSGIFCCNFDLVKNLLSDTDAVKWIDSPSPSKADPFDVMILQKYPKIFCHFSKGWNWSDVGTWNSLLEITGVNSEWDSKSVQEECTDVTVVNEDEGTIVTIGCRNLFIAMVNGNVLVMDTSSNRDAQIKKAVSSL